MMNVYSLAYVNRLDHCCRCSKLKAINPRVRPSSTVAEIVCTGTEEHVRDKDPETRNVCMDFVQRTK